MKSSRQKHELRIQLATKHCTLSPKTIAKMEANLGTLRTRAEQFPINDLYVTVTRFSRTGDYHVKTSLVLTGRTLFTGDRDVQVHPAFLRCVRKLVSKLDGYIEALGNRPAIAKLENGTNHPVVPTAALDGKEILRSVQDGDYAAFRRAADAYDEPLRRRVSRWLNRYPQLVARLGDELSIDDAVEEVFLNAYERFDERPQAVRLGDWLEDLIDPSMRVLLDRPDEERMSIGLAKTLQETDFPSAQAGANTMP
ncbi:MAG TPA: hypothetical protein VHC22_18275 [Pirellulales bacterium]|nr:hypothetical protein [Pirellulales bacterium]